MQAQVDTASSTEIENALAVHQEGEQRRKDIAEEAQIRYAEDVNQQKQTDTTSSAIIQSAINLAEEAQKRRELAERLVEEVHDREREIQNLLMQIGELYEIPLPGIDEKFATLQKQTDKNAEASLENAISIHAEAEQRRKTTDDLTEEIARNADNDTHNQAQIATLVNAILEDTLNLRDEISRRREALAQETKSRIARDVDLQAQVNEASTAGLENSFAIAQEAKQRRQSDERIEALRDESEHQREVDEYHQAQIDDVVRASLENSTAISEVSERRRADLAQETQERLAHDADLQAQVNEASAAGIENTLAIQYEAEQRRTFGERIEVLERESGFERDTYQRDQLDYIVNAILQDALNLRDEVERRREAIETGRQELIARTGDVQIQIDRASEGIIEDALAIQQSNETRRAEDSQERFTRIDEDGHIQDQVNTLAETCMQIMATNAETQEKINKIAKATEAISGTTGVAADSEVDEMLDEIYNS